MSTHRNPNDHPVRTSLAHAWRALRRLAVSCGLNLPDAWNRSNRVADWRRKPQQMPDRVPAVFAFLAG